MRARTRHQASLPSSDLPRAAERPMSSATCLRACRRPKTGPEVGSGKATASNSPRRRRRKASTRRRGQEVRLATVRFLTLPFSRKDSRRRTAGGEVRLGISATYMCSEYRATLVKSISIPIGNGAVFDLAVFAERLAKEDGRRRGAVGDFRDVHVFRI